MNDVVKSVIGKTIVDVIVCSDNITLVFDDRSELDIYATIDTNNCSLYGITEIACYLTDKAKQ